MTYEKNNKYINSKTSISDIIKIIGKANYKMSDNFISFIDFFNDCLFVNTLLSIYEIIELKAFQYLKEEMKIDNIQIEKKTKEEIIKYLAEDKLLLNDEILTNTFKKFILRYYLADNDNNLLAYLIEHFEDIFNKIAIFGNKIKDEKFEKERKKIISINKKDNCFIKYYINKLFNYNRYVPEVENQFEEEEKEDNSFIEVENEESEEKAFEMDENEEKDY